MSFTVLNQKVLHFFCKLNILIVSLHLFAIRNHKSSRISSHVTSDAIFSFFLVHAVIWTIVKCTEEKRRLTLNKVFLFEYKSYELKKFEIIKIKVLMKEQKNGKFG